jgi:hypothetical protein
MRSRALLVPVFVAALAAVSGACGASLDPGVVAYQPQRAEVAGSRHALVERVGAYAAFRGWKVETFDPQLGEVVALDQLDASTRQRWMFRVTDGVVEVEMRLELIEDGKVTTACGVCPTYRYAQEKLELAALADFPLVPTSLARR